MKQLWGQSTTFDAFENVEAARSQKAISAHRRPNTQRCFARWLLICTALLCAFAPGAIAQVITGDILGTVTDPNGAVVANATVSVRSLETHALRTTVSSANGDFSISLLPPGHYAITVEATGFKKYEVASVTLAGGDHARIDAKMDLGAASETVEVESAAPLLQTDSSSVGSLIPENTVADIPLNGRNLTNLVTQQVGVNAGMPGNITQGVRPDDRRQTSSVSANGQEEYFNSNSLDGIDNNERFYGLGGIKPSVDAIQQITVETNNFPAEEGRSAGAVVTVLTKAGANQFHGGVYEYLRNDVFDGEDFFLPSGFRKPEYRQNQFGGSIGGPIKKNKAFFFYDIEELRIVQGQTSAEQQVPGAADRAFVDSLPASIGQTIFNWFPAPNVPGNNFASNCGTATTAPCLYVSSPTKTQNSTTMDGRVDYNFGAKDNIFGRYSYNPVKSNYACYFPEVGGVCVGGAGFIANGNFPGTNNTLAQGAQINYTHVFSSSLVMELRTGFMRINIDSEPIGKGSNEGSKLGIPNSNPTNDPNATGVPGFHFLDGNADLGDQIAYPIRNIQNAFQYNGDLIYNHGAHSVKVGGALVRRQVNYLQEFSPEGWSFFAPIASGPDGVPSAPVTMALGIPAVFLNRQNMYAFEYYRTSEPSVFAQDDWRIRPWLTLNIGVRYDVFTPFTEAKGKIANFDPSKIAITVGGTGGIKTDYSDFAPRVGFSAQLGHDFLLRGGFGMSYYPGDFAGAITMFNPPYANPVSCSPIAYSCGVTATGQAVGQLSTGPPSSPAYQDPSIIFSPNAGGLNLVAKETNWRSAYMEQFNLIVQKQIGANVLTAGYVGSLGRRQVPSGGEDLNLPFPSANGTYQVASGAVPHYYATQMPGVSEVEAYYNETTSTYHAMQLVFERRMSKGLTINANYTWAHGLDSWGGYDSGGADAQWRGNRKYDWGNSDMDLRNRIAGTFTYELPFGKNLTGAGGLFLKGWAASSSTWWQTGLPFTAVSSNKPGGAFGDFNQSIRTNLVAGQGYYAAHKSPKGWLNLAAFTQAWPTDPAAQAAATTFTLGNEHSNQLHESHLRQADFALYKTQAIHEDFKLQFRAEAFNLSNTPNFARPQNDINAASTFGQIQSTSPGSNPRQFQFALKLMF